MTTTPMIAGLRLRIGAVLATACLALPGHASSPSEASRASLNASVAIPVALVQGSTQMFRDAGRFSVTGVKTAGNVSTLTLRNLADGAEASVQFSARAIEGSAIGAGVVLQASVSATGTLLVSAGKAVMFIPNEVGQALLHHSRARAE